MGVGRPGTRRPPLRPTVTDSCASCSFRGRGVDLLLVENEKRAVPATATDDERYSAAHLLAGSKPVRDQRASRLREIAEERVTE